MSAAEVILLTKRWIADFVIHLNLCPFAKKPFTAGQIRYRVVSSGGEEKLVRVILEELLFLNRSESAPIDTTLIIHPNLLEDFARYNDFLSEVDDLLNRSNLEGIIQIASFHPRYQFADAAPEDTGNYTNRSPFPMLHLLKENSVSKAILQYEDVTKIPENNVRLLNQIGHEALKKYGIKRKD